MNERANDVSCRTHYLGPRLCTRALLWVGRADCGANLLSGLASLCFVACYSKREDIMAELWALEQENREILNAYLTTNWQAGLHAYLLLAYTSGFKYSVLYILF